MRHERRRVSSPRPVRGFILTRKGVLAGGSVAAVKRPGRNLFRYAYCKTEQCEMRGCGDAKGAKRSRGVAVSHAHHGVHHDRQRPDCRLVKAKRKGRFLIPQVPFLVRTSRINASIISESTRKLVWRSFMTDSSKSSRPRRSAELRMLRVPRGVRPLVLAASRPCFSSIKIAGILSSRAKEIASVSPLPRPIPRSIWEGP